MPYSLATRNAMLDAVVVDLVSLHDGPPGALGDQNELAGGSYARVAIGFDAAVAGGRDSNTQPQFNIPAGTSPYIVGFWDAAGPAFRGWSPLGAGTLKVFTVDGATDVLSCRDHGLQNGDTVIVLAAEAALPGGLAGDGTLYHVVNATEDTLQLAAAAGGAAIDVLADGGGLLQVVTVESFVNAGQLQLTDADLELP